MEILNFLKTGGTPQKDFRKEVRGGEISISNKEVWYG
jgi:hypothetical protein